MADESIDERAIVEAAAKKKFRALSKPEADIQRRRLMASWRVKDSGRLSCATRVCV
jgi:hypothetical protein